MPGELQISELESWHLLEDDGGHVSESKETIDVTSKSTKDAERRRIRWYWVGLGTYFLILLNVARIAGGLPYQIFVLGALLNAAIIIGIILLLRRAYRRLRSQSPPTA